MLRILRRWACLVTAVTLGGCNAGTQDTSKLTEASVAQPAIDAAVTTEVSPIDACYSVENLGPVNFEGFDQQALGINARGTVAGANFDGGDRSAFIYEKGARFQLGDLGGGFSDARAINARGLAAGGSRTAEGNYRAASYYKGSVTDLGTLDGTSSWAQDVNDSGLVVGTASVSGVNHAAAFYGGQVFDLGILGGETYANGVNDRGDVVGSGRLPDGTWRAFLLSKGAEAMLELGTIGGVPGTATAWKVSNDGTVCGSSEAPNAYHGFLYRDGTMMELGDLGSSAYYGVSFCRDISDSGLAVGVADDINYWDHAVIWANPPGGLIDLNTRISPDLGVYLFWASNINSAGQITAYGVNTVSYEPVEGYLLSPVKCPSK